MKPKLSETEKKEEYLHKLILGFVAVVIVLALLGVSGGVINFVAKIFVDLFISAVFSLLATAIVEEVTGDFLKQYLLEIRIYGFKFSITLFALAVAIVGFAISR